MCGLAFGLHFSNASKTEPPGAGVLKKEFLVADAEPGSFLCDIVTREWQMTKMPMLDISRLFQSVQQKQSAGYPRQIATRFWRDRNLIARCDPSLTRSVEKIVAQLKLPSFESHLDRELVHSFLPLNVSLSKFHFPVDHFGSTRVEVDTHVAPYALLAFLTKPFIRVLIQSALEISGRDKQCGFSTGVGITHLRRGKDKEKLKGMSTRMLTPSHILRGVLARGWSDQLGVAMLGCLARSGIPVSLGIGAGTSTVQSQIKVEKLEGFGGPPT